MHVAAAARLSSPAVSRQRAPCVQFTQQRLHARRRRSGAVINTAPALERSLPSPRGPAEAALLAWRSSPLSAGPWAAPRDKTTYLFDLEVVGTQSLLYLLLGPPRCRLHRAAEPVQHPLERELLHRESPSSGSFVRRPLAPAAATSQPSAADSEPVLAEGRSVAPALHLVATAQGRPGPPPTPTRARHADDRRKLGEAPPPECTAMRLHWRIDSRDSGVHTRTGDTLSARPPRTGRKKRDTTDRCARPRSGERWTHIAHVGASCGRKISQLITK